MLPRRVLDLLGAGLVAAGIVKYWASNYAALEAIVVGLALGAATIAAGRIGGGPKPVPEGGYSMEDAMGVLRRATWGGITIGAVLTGLAFYFWITQPGLATVLDVLVIFALGLIVAYASLVAAAGLVVVDALKRDDGDEEPAAEPTAEDLPDGL